MKTNKIFLTSAICMCMMAPTYANIGANESEPGCIESKIGATSGDTNMEAIWGANTINLVYTANGETFTPTNSTAGTCTYDQHIVLPTNEPTRIGYTFDGWRVKGPFDLSTLSDYININAIYYSPYYASAYVTNNGYFDDRLNRGKLYYGFEKSDRNVWAAEFPYGKVKGEARCSTISPSSGQHGNVADEREQEGATHCWCCATGYAEPNSSIFQPVTSPACGYSYHASNEGRCAFDCTGSCASNVRQSPSIRANVYGVSSN